MTRVELVPLGAVGSEPRVVLEPAARAFFFLVESSSSCAENREHKHKHRHKYRHKSTTRNCEQFGDAIE